MSFGSGRVLMSVMAVSGAMSTGALADTSGRISLADLTGQEAVLGLIDNASFVPLVHPITNAVVSKDLKGDGTLPNDLGFTPLRQLGLYFYTHVTK